MNVIKRNISHQSEIDSHLHALNAVRSYSDNTIDITGTKRDIDHPQKTAIIMQDFTADIFPSPAFDVALMHDLPDRLRNPKFENAARIALKGYFESVGVDMVAYTACLLGDMEVIEMAAERYRKHVKDNDKGYVDAITNGTSGRLPSDYWLRDAVPVDTSGMVKTLKKTNLEAVSVKAAENIANILVPPPREASLLQDVIEAESFYSPFSKFQKLDGFAMGSDSVAAVTRLMKTGNFASINLAIDHLTRVSSEHGLDYVLDTFFEAENYEFNMAVTNNSGLDIAIGNIKVTVGDEKTAGTLRIKSLGSTAWKILKKTSVPPDIVAMKLFAEDENGAAELLRDVISDFQKRTSTRNNHGTPIYGRIVTSVRGEKNYVDKFSHTLRGLDVDESITEPKKKGSFKLAKAIFWPTSEYPSNDVPTIEVQVVTEKQRYDNRFGKHSHAGYKRTLKGSADNINSRRDRVRPSFLEVNGQSKKRGIDFLKEVGIEITPELSALLS